MNILWKGSPNYDTNRKPIDRIVLHWFGAGTLQSANDRFQNKSNQVSAHFGISDEVIWQWVDTDHVSYHSGNYMMNQRSIGIEHDGNPDKPITNATYLSSAELVSKLCRQYNIPLDREHIIGHREVKATQCPGTLDIDRVIAMAKNLSQSTYGDSELEQFLHDFGVQNLSDARKKWDEERGFLTGDRKKNEELQSENKQLRADMAEDQKAHESQVVKLEKEIVELKVSRDKWEQVSRALNLDTVEGITNLVIDLKKSLEGTDCQTLLNEQQKKLMKQIEAQREEFANQKELLKQQIGIPKIYEPTDYFNMWVESLLSKYFTKK